MTPTAGLPAWAALLSSMLLLVGAGLTLIGSLGLLRLKTFYARIHAPTLGTTLGMACIASASAITFTALQSRPVLHELPIVIFTTLTTPVTLMILVRAAVLRDRFEAASGILANSSEKPAGGSRSPALDA